MTLTFYKDNTEIMSQCVLWWQGRDQTTTGFPILPSGVTATPAGTWANDLSLGNNKSLKTFDGSTNYISLTDNDAWNFGSGEFSVCCWYTILNGDPMGVLYIINDQITDGNGVQIEVSGGLPYVYITDGSQRGITPDSAKVVSGWNNTALIRTGNTLQYYINGQLNSTSLTLGTVTNYSGPVNIGRRGCSSTPKYLNCNIKDLMIFKGRALTQPEIKLLMNRTNPNTGREFELLYPGQRGVIFVEC